MAVNVPGLTEEQQTQHDAILAAAQHNIAMMIDGLQTLEHEAYDELLEALDTATSEINKLRGE